MKERNVGSSSWSYEIKERLKLESNGALGSKLVRFVKGFETDQNPKKKKKRIENLF